MRTRLAPRLLLATLALAAAGAARAQVFPCDTYGTACRDAIPDAEAGSSSFLESTITVPPGVCSAASPVASVGISLHLFHDNLPDLGSISVTSPGGTAIPMANYFGGNDVDLTSPCGSPSGMSAYTLPSIWGPIVYTKALAGQPTASGTWTLRLQDHANMYYGALDGWSVDVQCGIPQVTLEAITPTTIEGYGAPGLIRITRSPVTTHPVRFTLTLTGTATSGADFPPISTAVEMCGGVASRDVTITGLLDTLPEGAETVVLTAAPDPAFALGSASATVTILDQVPPAITSAPTATFHLGRPESFTVVSIGTPSPTLTWSGTLPPGFTITLNAGGTATISGIAGAKGSFPLVFTATSEIGSSTQNFELVVLEETLWIPTLGVLGLAALAALLAAAALYALRV